MSKAVTSALAMGLAGKSPSELALVVGRTDSVCGRVALAPEFGALVLAKKRFIGFATAFYLAYYFTLIVLVGFAPEIMARPIFGSLNSAYVFALSQFFMAWILAALYLKRSVRYDAEVAAILKRLSSV